VNTRVNLTKRVKVSGKDRYCPAVIAANGRVKPGWVVVDGREEKHPNGNYYLDWTQDGKRKRLAVGSDAAQANTRLQRKEAELKAVAQGVAIVPEDGGTNGRPIQLAVADFLEEVRLTKQPKTFKGYEIALAYFQESYPKRYVEDIEKLDLLKFSAFIKNEKKQSPRSVHNKFACVLTFLSANGIPKLVGKNDRPRFVNQQVEIYEDGELERLFHVCSPYHLTLYKFLLMTGLREKEAMYCMWNDVNLKASTINMRWKPQYDFAPKAYREREIPIPTKLVNALKGYRANNAKGDSLVFCTASGRPDTHMLRALKRNAVRAGLDPAGFWIHKFRSTFATMHLQAGADLRSVQAWLGHTNLESTIRYLKPARAEAMLDRVNATFG
jgi:integrase/recombinase XerD